MLLICDCPAGFHVAGSEECDHQAPRPKRGGWGAALFVLALVALLIAVIVGVTSSDTSSDTAKPPVSVTGPDGISWG